MRSMNIVQRWRVTAAAGLLALSACGGGTSGSAPTEVSATSARERAQALVTTTSATAAATTAVTPAQASRFLAQATWGPDMDDIKHVAAVGYARWLTEQFATPPMDSHYAYAITRHGPPGCVNCDSPYIQAVAGSLWRQAVQGPDQLRQRLVWALSELFVISAVNSPISIEAKAHASYFDMLAKYAFGNYRDLLEAVTRHPSMGLYLTYMYNLPEDPVSGRTPDENFARESMQLFTIGLWQLNMDGTRKKDANGNDIPTFDQDDVMGLARVMTGFGWGGVPRTKRSWFSVQNRWRTPMSIYPDFHETGEKRILNGVVIPANTPGDASLKIALDTLFNHPNTGPFLATRLIRQFVTSNPSPAYVGRVAQAFADNGAQVRGDMKAVMRAVLLDPEARDDSKITDPQWGKLREPLIRYGNFMRAFSVTSTSGVYPIANLCYPTSCIGQAPLLTPSVFNWFQPDFSPPGPIEDAGLVAPEFQILHETTSTGYANFAVNIAFNETAVTKRGVHNYIARRKFLLGDYTAEIALATKPSQLIDRLDLLFTAGNLTPRTRQTILTALQDMPADTPTRRSLRVSAAVALIMASPDYVIQK